MIQENDFQGHVELNAELPHGFYSYSLWRVGSGEHLFDGIAGDLKEAMETIRAHITRFSAERVMPYQGVAIAYENNDRGARQY